MEKRNEYSTFFLLLSLQECKICLMDSDKDKMVTLNDCKCQFCEEVSDNLSRNLFQPIYVAVSGAVHQPRDHVWQLQYLVS